ncbi:MAG: PQQ-like beta-propeller repeat protein [Phycisphaerae bacterium]|nr:PQQ-like beta-propeller repeat protein [Phycisphaerae bacterium]
MRTALTLAIALLPLTGTLARAEEALDPARQWGQWRGPRATGVAPHAQPPTQWSERRNLRWKTALPGKGHGTPIIWGDRIFLTAAIPAGEAVKPRYSGRPGAHDNLPVTHRQRFVALALDRSDGRILWQKTLHEALPREGGHESASLASASPVTDGRHLFAFFGSHGLYCLDLAGNLLWQTNLGQMHTKHGHGEGASPALYGDTLLVNWDHQDQSFLIAFDKTTGKVRWKLERDEVTSWSTPIVVNHKGHAQAIVPGTRRLRAYDTATGKVIWECGGLSANICASPVYGRGMVFVGSSYNTRAMLAVRLNGARGDITGTDRVAWRRTRGTPYVPSPLLTDHALYFLAHYQNVLSRVDPETGDNAGGPYRLTGLRNIYASPVAAAGRVYITDRDGTTLVMTDEAEPKYLSLNRLDDRFSASPALVGHELYLRGEKHLYCITQAQE